MRGRKPTPTRLKVITGNPGRRPLPDAEPQIPAASLKAPAYLKGDARREWQRVAPALVVSGVLTQADVSSFAAYCTAYGRWRTAEKAIAEMAKRDKLTQGLMIKTTNGNAIQNPLIGTSNKAMADMMRYAAEFGLTASARSRISADNSGRRDPADKFFR